MIINTALTLAVVATFLATVATARMVHAQTSQPTVVDKLRPIVS